MDFLPLSFQLSSFRFHTFVRLPVAVPLQARTIEEARSSSKWCCNQSFERYAAHSFAFPSEIRMCPGRVDCLCILHEVRRYAHCHLGVVIHRFQTHPQDLWSSCCMFQASFLLFLGADSQLMFEVPLSQWDNVALHPTCRTGYWQQQWKNSNHDKGSAWKRCRRVLPGELAFSVFFSACWVCWWSWWKRVPLTMRGAPRF